ncbi:MAG: hypothetical protein MRK01_13430 [Candidatus Scalindua sp.]|nr:hypothetical protein [Candidatus Scalindua sp.]
MSAGNSIIGKKMSIYSPVAKQRKSRVMKEGDWLSKEILGAANVVLVII